ncbi:MAG: ATP-binding cassette domain-containing protein [Deltaproteobacteria bacterium]|nr:ATP-binding cassette domain-containing protein [Deltaproteobacteria bacterium]
MLSVDVTFARDARAPTLSVALDAPPGFTAIVGPSGAGKSTTLALVAGLLRPNRGRVTLGDEVWTDVQRQVHLTPDARRVGFVFQSLALFPHLDAVDNVAFGVRDAPRARRRHVAREWLARCEVGHVAHRRPLALSGGEAQRVALARAFASAPRVLLLDEPLSALDADLRDGLRATLRALVASTGIVALLVTHDRADALALAPRAALLRDGRVERAGATADVLGVA